MPAFDPAPFGILLDPALPDLTDLAAWAESLGYSAIWLAGGRLTDLDQVAAVVRSTRSLTVGTAILAVDRFPAPDVAALHHELERVAPGRCVLGLGGAHGPHPIGTLTAYLDELDGLDVPRPRTVLSALGPRMLDLAAERTAGALPTLATPEWTARARSTLPDDARLVLLQISVLAADPATGTAAARERIRFLASLPAYRAHLGRQGFTDDEIETLDDRLVRSVVAVGDAAAIAGHVRRQHDAGADQVIVGVADLGDLEPLAGVLGLR